MTERIVVVGAGMAATRLVEGLVARGLGPRVTLVGEERQPPYNRILLSAVLEGRHRPSALTLRPPAWFEQSGVDLRLGTRVARIDTGAHTVVFESGEEQTYDRLVLATGSIPTLPPIRGLVRTDGTLDPRVHPFRRFDDCVRLLDAVPAARRAVIVGGGLLGLQVARALALRGVATEIVEGAEHVMPAYLANEGAQVLTGMLSKLGTQVYAGARAVRLTADGLRLDNGYVLETDLVVLTAGGRPSANLARRAGLTVRRGIVVDDTLASVDDPRVYAVGDCAETLSDAGGRITGFVSPAWEQAEVLAARLAGEPTVYTGTRRVARLRASDLEVAVLGDPESAVGKQVVVTNPVTGTHRKLVVRDGAIVAGTLVGDLSGIGTITQHFDRGTVLGAHEPGALLMPTRPTRPAAMPVVDDGAEICACAGVSAERIRACASLDEVRETTRATTGCGGCAGAVESLLRPLVKGTNR